MAPERRCAALPPARFLDLLHGRLEDGEAEGVRQHLASCAACVATWRDLEAIHDVLAEGFPGPAAPPDFAEGILTRLLALERGRWRPPHLGGTFEPGTLRLLRAAGYQAAPAPLRELRRGGRRPGRGSSAGGPEHRGRLPWRAASGHKEGDLK